LNVEFDFNLADGRISRITWFSCIRTKLRGHLKVLITKLNKETYQVAQLITVGIVISLEIE